MNRRRHGWWLLALLSGCMAVDKGQHDPLPAGQWRSTKARMYHDLAL